ncbi:MAG: hypothetical protein QOF76_4202, partial [Solirubrobacteraceae bacterium]|nr:hypothetical protein [Solirubrobacteraceae bacterium]
MRGLLRNVIASLRHPIGQNAVSLSWVQLATFVIPLATLPYVSRVLGKEQFGLVVFAQGIALVLGLVVDYGFEATAARDAAAARNDPGKLATLVADVLTARLILCALTLLAAAVALVAVPDMRDHPDLLGLAVVTALAQGLAPGWFFIGIERLRLISVVQLFTRLVAAGLTFPLVRDEGDAWVVLALLAAGTVASGAIATVMLYRIVDHAPLRLHAGLATLRRTAVAFVGIGVLSLYSSANVVLLGLLSTTATVAYFGAADRLVRAALQVLSPIGVAVFPRLAFLLSARESARARRLAWLSISVLAGLGLVMGAALLVLAGPIVDLIFGSDFARTAPVLRVLCAIVPLIAIVSTLAGGWMLAQRMEAAILRCAGRAAATNVLLAFVLVPSHGAVGMACAV